MALTRLDNIEQIYPLTPMQQGMLFHTIHNNSGEYFEITSCTIKGDLQVDAFEKAINRLVDRHTALRSSFVWKKVERMQQIVHKNVTIPLHFEDWTTFSEQEQKEKFDTALRNERENGFNLSKPPLLRFAVFKLEKDTHKFYWCFNHILCDGWSTPIVLNEVMTAYNVIVNNSPDDLPPARPFKSYIDWISAQDQGRARAFWSELLGDFSAPATLVKNNHNSEMEHDYLKNSFAFSVYLSSNSQMLRKDTMLQSTRLSRPHGRY